MKKWSEGACDFFLFYRKHLATTDWTIHKPWRRICPKKQPTICLEVLEWRTTGVRSSWIHLVTIWPMFFEVPSFFSLCICLHYLIEQQTLATNRWLCSISSKMVKLISFKGYNINSFWTAWMFLSEQPFLTAFSTFTIERTATKIKYVIPVFQIG